MNTCATSPWATVRPKGSATGTTPSGCADSPTGSPNTSPSAAPRSCTPTWPCAAASPGRSEPNSWGLLALRPDLATVVAGVNDALRPRFDAAAVIGHVEEMFAALTQAGAHVVTLTFPDVTKIVPLARPIRPRLLDLNARIRSAAARHGVTVVETGRSAVATDPRLWGADRLHASPLGHERIAAAAARTLGLPGSDDTWSLPLPPRTVPTGRQATGAELRWAAAFLGPWLGRRLRARSSGDGRTSKRPQLLPVIITSPSAEDMGRRELP